MKFCFRPTKLFDELIAEKSASVCYRFSEERFFGFELLVSSSPRLVAQSTLDSQVYSKITIMPGASHPSLSLSLSLYMYFIMFLVHENLYKQMNNEIIGKRGNYF